MVNDVGCEEQHADSTADNQRLKSLSNFQAMLLRHSLKFPSVRRVVYSTCSIFEQENELVIHDVLQSASSAFQLVDVLPMLSSRGESSMLLQAKSCVRLSPEMSLTEGFFIACLERVEVPPYPLSAAKLQVGGQSHMASIVSELTCAEMQTENAAADGRKLHRHRKSKKEKAAIFKRSEADVTVVEEKLNSELDEQLQKSLNGKMFFIPEPTAATLETEYNTTEKKRKLHKHKKSKNEKAAKVAKLEHSKGDTPGLDHAKNSLDTVISEEQDAEKKKSHKHKKSKKNKIVKIEQSETISVDEEKSVRDSRMSHKHKKSKSDSAGKT